MRKSETHTGREKEREESAVTVGVNNGSNILQKEKKKRVLAEKTEKGNNITRE